ncbi:MAG: pentapeptide repeat-containing protein [Nitrospiria bacterium]
MKIFLKVHSLFGKGVPGFFLIAKKRSPLRRVLAGVLIYFAFFAIVSQMHHHKKTQFDNKAIRVYSQLSVRNPEKAVKLIPDPQALFAPEKPNIFNPSAVFFSLFSFPEVHSEGVKTLKHFIAMFKENLSGVDLSELDLSGKGMDFSGANFSHANLTRANFGSANLAGANLSGANLTEADLSGVDLIGAVLRGTNLSRADLNRAILTKADLSKAVLREARIADADLSRANLFFADLSGIILRSSRLVGADLSGVTLYHADLIATDLSRARLSGADLNGADLRYANLTHTTGLNQAQLDRGIVDEMTKLPPGLSRSKTVK